MDEKRDLKSLRPIRFHSLGSLQEKLTEEELQDFLQISSDIDISLDLESVGDYLRKLEEKENRFRVKRLSRNQDDPPLKTDSFTSTSDQVDPVSGYSFCTATSSEEDTELSVEGENAPLNKTSECDPCDADHPTEKVSTNMESFSRADNTSCNSNVDTLLEMLPNKSMMLSLPTPVEKVSSGEESSTKENDVSCITSVPRSVEKRPSDTRGYTKEIVSCITNLSNPVEKVSSDNKICPKRKVFDKIYVLSPAEKVSLDKQNCTKEDVLCNTDILTPVDEESSDKKSCPKGNVSDKINVFSQLEKMSLDKKSSSKKEATLRSISFLSSIDDISSNRKSFTNGNLSRNTNVINPVDEVSSDKKSSSKEDVSGNMTDPTSVTEMSLAKKIITKKNYVLSNITDPITAEVLSLDKKNITNDGYLLYNTNVASPIEEASSNKKTPVTENDVSSITDVLCPLKEVSSDTTDCPRENVSDNTNVLNQDEEESLDKGSCTVEDNASCNTNVQSAVGVVSSNSFTAQDDTLRNSSIATLVQDNVQSAVGVVSPNSFTAKDDPLRNSNIATLVQEVSLAKISTKKDDTLCTINVAGEMSLDKYSSVQDKMSCDTEFPTRDEDVSSGKKIFPKKDDASCDTSVSDVAVKISLDEKSSQKENVSSDNNVPSPVKEMPLVNKGFVKKDDATCNTSVTSSDVSHPAVLADTLDNTATKTAKLQDNILKEADPTDKSNTDVSSTPQSGTPFKCLSPCKVLKKPMSLTEICKRKDRIQAFSNSDTAVGNYEKDGKLQKTYFKSRVINNKYADLQGSSDGKFSEETPEVSPRLAITGNVDVTTSNQICGQGEGDFVVVDGDSVLQENEISNDTVEIMECKENDTKQLCYLTGEELEHELKESKDKDSSTPFCIPVDNPPDMIIPVEQNPLVQYALQQIEKSQNHSSDADMKRVNLPSVEYFAMPGDFLCESVESSDLLDAFETQEMKISEISESLYHISASASDHFNLPAVESIAIPCCSSEQDPLQMYNKTEYENNEHSKEMETESLQKHVAHTWNFTSLTSIPGDTSMNNKVPTQINKPSGSFDQQGNKLPQDDKSLKHGEQKGKIMAISSQFQTGSCLQHVSVNEVNNFSSPVVELLTSSVDLLPVVILSPVNNGQVEKEPSEITETSDSASATFNTASIGFSSEPDSLQEGTSIAQDNIVSQLNEVFSSFEQQEIKAAREPPEVATNSIEDMFNTASQASFSTSDFSFQLDDSFQDASDMCDSIDSLVESLLHKPEQRQNDTKQNDSPSMHNNYTFTNMQRNIFEDILPGSHERNDTIEDILPGKYSKRNYRTISSQKHGEPNHKDKHTSPGTYGKLKNTESKVKKPGFDYSEVEVQENDSYLSLASTDMQQTSLPSRCYQLRKNEDQNWGLEIDSDVKKYASLLQDKPTSPLYRNSFLKRKVQSLGLDTTESDSDIKLDAQRFTSNALAEGTSPKTDCMSLQEFFDSTKQLAFNERSWDFFDATSGEDVPHTSSGEFRYLERNALEKSDFEMFERDTKHQQLPFYSFEEKSTIPKSNRFSGPNQDPRNKEKGNLKRNAQGILCINTKMHRRN